MNTTKPEVKTIGERITEAYQNPAFLEGYFQATFGLMTGGMSNLAEEGASWLVEAIFSYTRKERFQVWTLVVADEKAVLTMKEDTGAPDLVRQEIQYTDFPVGTWKFYVSEGILMIPSEY